MKKKISLLAAVTLAMIVSVTSLAMSPSSALADDGATAGLGNAVVLLVGSPKALVYGAAKQIDSNAAVVPFIENSRTMMPLSFVANALGFDVSWADATKTATLEKDSLTLQFVLGSKIMKQNGKNVTMDAASISKNGRTLVPISYVAKAMGLNVTYDRGLIILDKERTYNVKTDAALINEGIAALSGLPAVGSAANLKDILAKLSITNNGVYKGEKMTMSENQTAMEMAPAADAARGADDYSQTNVQVAGVDEADVVKTDGQYIYHLNFNIPAINIVKAYPADSMKTVSTISYSNEANGFYPSQMYIDGNLLIVIGYTWVPADPVETMTEPKASDGATAPAVSSKMIADYRYYGTSVAKVIVYDIANKEKPVVTREFSVEGSTVDSRKIGDTLYLVVNQYLDTYNITDLIEILPTYYDSASGKVKKTIDCVTMQYFPEAQDNSLLMICGINLKNSLADAQIASILGSGQQIYMSESSLYVTKYNYAYNIGIMRTSIDIAPGSNQLSDATSIFRFTLSDGYAVYNATGVVEGSVLNQYSMDEYEGYFRIATTKGGWGENLRNQLYVLDSSMNITGSIKEMAPGERVYSARFMGDRAFMVTYRTVDPLFAIDLSNPSSPTVLGELKIPGYSTYLHPYDENHLIGFGMDTDQVTSTDSKGNVVDVRTVNVGLKLAMFDISDMMNPKELSSVSFGNQSTYSELLYNPKAMVFSKEKGFFAFPVTSYQYTDYSGKTHESFSGAYVFDIGLNGISERGTISQLNASDYDQYGSYDYNKAIQRILYIGDTFYTLSGYGIQANEITSLSYKNSVAYTLQAE